MIKKLWFPQQPELGCITRAEGLRWLALLLNLCLHLPRCDAAGLGLPWEWEVRFCAGVNVEKLAGPLPSYALRCLGGWQLPPSPACSQHGGWKHLPGFQSSPAPGTGVPLPGTSISNPFSSSFPQYSHFLKCTFFFFSFFSPWFLVRLGTLPPVFSLISPGSILSLTSPSPSCFSLHALTGGRSARWSLLDEGSANHLYKIYLLNVLNTLVFPKPAGDPMLLLVCSGWFVNLVPKQQWSLRQSNISGCNEISFGFCRGALWVM